MFTNVFLKLKNDYLFCLPDESVFLITDKLVVLYQTMYVQAARRFGDRLASSTPSREVHEQYGIKLV
jgi:hypothetical protein